jgi:hypothetical protein
MMIDFEFPQSLKNSTTTFQVALKQPAMTDLIDGPTRPPTGTSSTTTLSSGLVLTEIRTIEPEEQAIEKRSIPPASIQRLTDLR